MEREILVVDAVGCSDWIGLLRYNTNYTLKSSKED
jgi:hypothetical protein